MLVIGSRGSPLALVQARHVQSLLARAHGVDLDAVETRFPIKIFKTTGDVLTGRLSESGGKGLFVKELDEALARGDIDMAVHSMKDVPTQLDDMFEVSAILPREDVRDAFISKTVSRFEDLPRGAVIGTASLRRQAQAARLRPDLSFVLLRGNVGTRLKRLEENVCDATFLAVAGLNRLNQTTAISQKMDVDDMLPAPAQGAVGVQIRKEDEAARIATQSLHDIKTDICITAERAFLAALNGSCRTPIAAFAQLKNANLSLRAEALSADGKERVFGETIVALPSSGFAEESAQALLTAQATGLALGEKVKAEAGDRIIWDML